MFSNVLVFISSNVCILSSVNVFVNDTSKQVGFYVFFLFVLLLLLGWGRGYANQQLSLSFHS